VNLKELFTGLLDVGASDDTLLSLARDIAAQATSERRDREPNENVWVYVMEVETPDDPLVKVGISKHPAWRKHELEKIRGLDLRIAHKAGPYFRPVALDIERRAHKRMAHMQESGEWFMTGSALAAAVVQICAQEALQ